MNPRNSRRTIPLVDDVVPAATWMDAVYDEYIRQCDAYEKTMDKVHFTPCQSVFCFGVPIKFAGKIERYAFWPKHKPEFHVLY